MLEHRGFSAWIEVDGKPLPEFLIALDMQQHQVSCWIPSKEGQAFSVFWQDHGGNVDTCAFITLDGFTVPGRFLFGKSMASRSGVRTSNNTERPFVFQKIDPTQALGQEINKDQGMITLKIKRVSRVSAVNANEILDAPSRDNERMMTGDVRVGFGEETKTWQQYPATWSVKAYDPEGGRAQKPSTYVSFVFRYRSLDFLRMQGIVPYIAPNYEFVVEEAQPSGSKSRIPPRRVVSAPVVASSLSSRDMPPPPVPASAMQRQSQPQPTPQSQTPKQAMQFHPYMNLGVHPSRRPTNDRRSASMRAMMSTLTEVKIPGESVIQFDTPVQNQNAQKHSELPHIGVMTDLSDSRYAMNNAPPRS